MTQSKELLEGGSNNWWKREETPCWLTTPTPACPPRVTSWQKGPYRRDTSLAKLRGNITSSSRDEPCSATARRLKSQIGTAKPAAKIWGTQYWCQMGQRVYHCRDGGPYQCTAPDDYPLKYFSHFLKTTSILSKKNGGQIRPKGLFFETFWANSSGGFEGPETLS